MAEYLPIYKPGQALTLKASGAITGGQLVAISGSGTVATAGAAAANWIGVAAFDAAIERQRHDPLQWRPEPDRLRRDHGRRLARHGGHGSGGDRCRGHPIGVRRGRPHHRGQRRQGPRQARPLISAANSPSTL
jgi:hypothetical protein